MDSHLQELQNLAQMEQLLPENQKIWLKIQLLQVLCNGRVKPENQSNQVNKSEAGLFGSSNCNSTGVIRDSKEFIPLINGICKSLQEDLVIYPMSKTLND